MQKSCKILLTAIFLFSSVNSASEKTSLTEITGIYAEHPLSGPDSRAIGLINGIFYKIYKKRLPVKKEYKPEENLFVIGKAAVTQGFITPEELKKASPGGFVIKCSGGKISVAGTYPWATVYGAGRLAEKFGVWYSRGPHIFSYPDSLPEKLEPFIIIDKPVFRYRNGSCFLLGEMAYETADARKGADEEIFKKTDLWIDHTAGYLVPKDLYYDKHPEYYAVTKNGKRIAKDRFTYHRTPLCLSNPDVGRISAERALKWVARQSDKIYFFITNGDTSLWCQCRECNALLPEPGMYAALNLPWVNRVAEAVYEKYPDKIIFTFAYAGSDEAPENIKPAENVCVIAATGLGNIPFYRHEKKAESSRYTSGWQKLDGWLKTCAIKPLVCEYIGGVYQPAFISQTADRFRDYNEKGIGGTAFSYGLPTNFKHVWWYLHSKLLWNPEFDALQLAKDFALNYYGPGGEAIGRYFDLCRQQYQNTCSTGQKMLDGYPQDFYSDKYIKEAFRLFTEAETAADKDKKIKAEIAAEKVLFLEDSLKHLPGYSLDENNKKLITFILDNMIESARKSGKFVDTIRQLDITARNLARVKNSQLLDFIRSKLGKTEEFKPEKIKDGYRFSPAMFQGADKGPEVFDAKMSHKSLPCPPKFCAGVLA
ncbi:MAG: DUF4838 domain-containing protein, partial [Planctomycetota bacterium]